MLCVQPSWAQELLSISRRDTIVPSLPSVVADSIALQGSLKSHRLPLTDEVMDKSTPIAVKTTKPVLESKRKSKFVPNPKVALLWSIIPGGGQVYNRKYWKLPIIATAYTGFYYAITWNHNNLTEYANAFRDIKSDTPLENRSWTDFIPSNANPEDYINNTSFHERLRRGRDFYQRNRDLSIILSVATYILIMVDAYVDAELYSFDISPNVSLSYQPVITAPTVVTPQTSYGLQVALRF